MLCGSVPWTGAAGGSLNLDRQQRSLGAQGHRGRPISQPKSQKETRPLLLLALPLLHCEHTNQVFRSSHGPSRGAPEHDLAARWRKSHCLTMRRQLASSPALQRLCRYSPLLVSSTDSIKFVCCSGRQHRNMASSVLPASHSWPTVLTCSEADNSALVLVWTS